MIQKSLRICISIFIFLMKGTKIRLLIKNGRRSPVCPVKKNDVLFFSYLCSMDYITHIYNSLIIRTNCLLAGTRTLDPMIKSHLLYQLSYEEKGAKVHIFSDMR